ncbi:uncharacterized protein [Musca autumnalis]|uniref:uncharacterized protein n=1 Tax=Musca autumnalis TaxID=221902 RepID=UPI003CE95449
MSAGTRSRTKERKRDRPTEFDKNRSIIIENKKKKDYTDLEMAENNPTEDGQIRDLSRTINVNSPITNSLGPVFLQGRIGQQMNEMPGGAPGDQVVGNNLLQNQIVNLKEEMDEIKKSLIELTRVMKENNQAVENVKKTVEGNSSGSNRHSASQATSGNSASTLPNVPQAPPPGNPVGTGSCNRNTNSELPSMANAIIPHIPPRETPSEPEPTGRPPIPQHGTHERYSAPFDPRTSVRINKLGLRFDGSSTGLGVEEFVYRLEYFKRQYGIPWSEIIRDFPLLLSGRAESWYWLFQKTNREHNWECLKSSLLSQYQSSKTNVEILTELAQRKQQPNETIDNYFHVMGQIRAKLFQPIYEPDMVKIMKKNIRESISRIVYPIQVSTVEQLRIECNEAEKTFLRRENRVFAPQTRPTRQVNEVNFDFNDYSYEGDQNSCNVEDVEAFQMQRKQNPNITCWNCLKSGHGFRDCDAAERALFCYKCGNPGTKTPKCNVCQSGNRNRGVENKGGPRPAENP